MSKFMVLMGAGAVAVTSLYAAPAAAGGQSSPSIAEIIVYGNDPCPRSTDDEVVVCSRRPEAERYRIPPAMRSNGTVQQNESWARRSEPLETVGSTGINSCSPVGPAGYTGCLQRVIKEVRGERKHQADEAVPPQQ